jgi:hypothetical protein
VHLPADASLIEESLAVHAVEEVRQYRGDNLDGNVGHRNALT